MDLGKEFTEYRLDDHLINTLNQLGFTRCTPIQEKAIPLVISGQDVAGLAQTGTGKTAAFLLPIFERVLRSEKKTDDEELNARAFVDWKPGQFNLVLVPTRELAEQVKDCALDFIKGTEHRCVVVYGGVPIEKQIEQLGKGFTFLIATPGRLIDLYKEHKVDLKQVRSVTFDEADRMFDMGFKDDMKYILQRIPEKRQLLLFSATLNLDVFNVAYQFGANPVEIKVSQDQMTADNVEDCIYHVGRHEKPGHLLGLLKKLQPKQVIIFTNYKNSVERIAEFLNKNECKAVGISSLLTQAQRQRVMTRFREEGGENILVATDVAARGLDIQGVDLVINYELPDDAENYVHRIGRTGRAGEKGKAFSFVSDKDVEALDRIQKYLNRSVTTEWMEDADLPKEFVPFPADLSFRKDRSKSGFASKGGRPDSRNKKKDFRSSSSSDTRRPDSRRPEGGRRPDPRRSEAASSDGSTRRPDSRRPDPNRSASGGQRDQGERNVHRDKRSGRHKERTESSNSVQQPRNAKPRRHSSENRNSNRKFVHKKASTPAAAAPKSVVGRLTSAIKSLFK